MRAVSTSAVSIGRAAALARRKQAIERSIEDELKRPAPCGLILQDLKRRRLALKEDLSRLRALAASRLRAV